MKFFAVTLFLVITTYARPDISLIPSGSYLPGGGLGQDGVNLKSSTGGVGGNLLGSGSFIGDQVRGDLISGFGIGVGSGLVHDHKTVHFYGAPEEHRVPLRIYVSPNSAKNTKLIFVKAPSYELTPEVIAPSSHTEDKTVVYVLVRKPKNGGSISIPTSLSTKPTKPEVFFIKYKNEKEAQQALAGGLQEKPVGSNAPELGNAQSFIGTLKTDVARGISGIDSVTIGGIRGGDISGSCLLAGVAGGTAKYGPVGASGPY